MIDALRLVDGLALLLFASIYLGTGVTLVFFLLPIAPQLTTETYRIPFLEPIKGSTRFFTIMTPLMMLGAVGLIALEAGSRLWIAPAAYLVLTLAATLYTTRVMFAINARLRAGIDDPAELQAIFVEWRHQNAWRAALWFGEWVAIATWFGIRVADGF